MKRLPLIGIVAMMLVAGIAIVAHEYEDTTDHCSASVSTFGWNGEYWLISGHDEDGYLLVTYDGETFTEIEGPWGSEDFDFENSEISFSILNMGISPKEFYSYPAFGDWVRGWFGGHWLLSGTEWISAFDGGEFVTTSLHTPLTTMTCGDAYCLIVGRSYPGQASHPVLVRYDGEELSTDMFTVLYDQMTEKGVATMPLALTKGDGGNWYIATQYLQGEDGSFGGTVLELLTYDGTTFEKVVDLPEKFYVRSMGYNGECLLLTDSQRLLRYEDGGFTDVTSGIDVEWAPSKWGNDIAWADEYWMTMMNGHLFAYDGDTFTELMSGVEDIAWNGEYWLIDSDSALLRYDGETFTDLTCAFRDAGTSPGRPAWHYLVLALAALAIAALAYVRERG